MKKYLIFWETDYCDDFPENMGETEIEALSEEEAEIKFNALKIPKAIAYRITEI